MFQAIAAHFYAKVSFESFFLQISEAVFENFPKQLGIKNFNYPSLSPVGPVN